MDYCNPNHIDPHYSLTRSKRYSVPSAVTYCPMCEATWQKHWASPDREQPASWWRQFTTGAKVPGVITAGKSGTAQLGGTGEPHSWFIGFAPASAPKVVIAVIVEQAGRGAEVAAPIAGNLMALYLKSAP